MKRKLRVPALRFGADSAWQLVSDCANAIGREAAAIKVATIGSVIFFIYSYFYFYKNATEKKVILRASSYHEFGEYLFLLGVAIFEYLTLFTNKNRAA
ncbi:MAG: hypothetical protein ACRC9R_03915 [Enterovibrio sp.]